MKRWLLVFLFPPTFIIAQTPDHFNIGHIGGPFQAGEEFVIWDSLSLDTFLSYSYSDPVYVAGATSGEDACIIFPNPFGSEKIEEDPDKPVVIRADKMVLHGVVLAVLRSAKILGAQNIAIGTMQKGKGK